MVEDLDNLLLYSSFLYEVGRDDVSFRRFRAEQIANDNIDSLFEPRRYLVSQLPNLCRHWLLIERQFEATSIRQMLFLRMKDLR